MAHEPTLHELLTAITAFHTWDAAQHSPRLGELERETAQQMARDCWNRAKELALGAKPQVLTGLGCLAGNIDALLRMVGMKARAGERKNGG